MSVLYEHAFCYVDWLAKPCEEKWEKKQEYDIMSKLGEVTKKKSLSMSKTKIKKE